MLEQNANNNPSTNNLLTTTDPKTLVKHLLTLQSFERFERHYDTAFVCSRNVDGEQITHYLTPEQIFIVIGFLNAHGVACQFIDDQLRTDDGKTRNEFYISFQYIPFPDEKPVANKNATIKQIQDALNSPYPADSHQISSLSLLSERDRRALAAMRLGLDSSSERLAYDIFQNIINIETNRKTPPATETVSCYSREIDSLHEHEQVKITEYLRELLHDPSVTIKINSGTKQVETQRDYYVDRSFKNFAVTYTIPEQDTIKAVFANSTANTASNTAATKVISFAEARYYVDCLRKLNYDGKVNGGYVCHTALAEKYARILVPFFNYHNLPCEVKQLSPNPLSYTAISQPYLVFKIPYLNSPESAVKAEIDDIMAWGIKHPFEPRPKPAKYNFPYTEHTISIEVAAPFIEQLLTRPYKNDGFTDISWELIKNLMPFFQYFGKIHGFKCVHAEFKDSYTTVSQMKFERLDSPSKTPQYLSKEEIISNIKKIQSRGFETAANNSSNTVKPVPPSSNNSSSSSSSSSVVTAEKSVVATDSSASTSSITQKPMLNAPRDDNNLTATNSVALSPQEKIDGIALLKKIQALYKQDQAQNRTVMVETQNLYTVERLKILSAVLNENSPFEGKLKISEGFRIKPTDPFEYELTFVCTLKEDSRSKGEFSHTPAALKK